MEGNIYDYTLRNAPWSWREFFEQRMKYIKAVSDTVDKDVKLGEIVLPPMEYLWNAFVYTAHNNVKVVLLGQDPYPTPGNATGLSFSVKKGNEIPKSLINMYNVLAKTVYGFEIPEHGDLTNWAIQGVLMINTAYTVIAGKPNSHSRTWKQFTDPLIEYLSDNYNNLVFLLWGKEAQKYRKFIDKRKHLVLETSHPSPLGYHCGFKDSDHFNQTNEYLIKNKKSPINWCLHLDPFSPPPVKPIETPEEILETQEEIPKKSEENTVETLNNVETLNSVETLDNFEQKIDKPTK